METKNITALDKVSEARAADERGRNYFDKVLSVAIEVGGELLSSGCPVGRVEIAVEFMCKAFGAAEVNVFCIPSMILAGVKLADGSEITQLKRIYSLSNNFARMTAFNQLSRDISNKKYTLAEAATMVANLKGENKTDKLVSGLSGGIGAGSFAIFYGGSLLDAIPAAIIGGLMAFLVCILSRLAFNGYARTFMLSLIGGLGSIALCALMAFFGLNMHVSPVMMGTIMIVIPGLLICNAIRDLFSGDIYSGSFEILSGILTTLAIVAGYAVALMAVNIPGIGKLLPVNTVQFREQFSAEDYLYRIIFCFIGTTAFTLFFGGSVKKLIPSAFSAMVTFGIWLIMERFDPIVNQYKTLVDMLVATIVAATLSEIFARTHKAPSIIFFVPGIIIFVPGRSLYLTVVNLINGETQLAAQYGVEMGMILIGIVVGIILVTLLFQIINPSRHRRYLRKKINK